VEAFDAAFISLSDSGDCNWGGSCGREQWDDLGEKFISTFAFTFRDPVVNQIVFVDFHLGGFNLGK